MPLKLRRIYDYQSPSDGKRVLVDRIWPRGLSKEKAAVDQWLKEVAPTTELRKWFAHDTVRWQEFRDRYRQELDAHREALEPLASQAARGTVTLLFGAKDTQHNNAVVLKEYLEEEFGI